MSKSPAFSCCVFKNSRILLFLSVLFRHRRGFPFQSQVEGENPDSIVRRTFVAADASKPSARSRTRKQKTKKAFPETMIDRKIMTRVEEPTLVASCEISSEVSNLTRRERVVAGGCERFRTLRNGLIFAFAIGWIENRKDIGSVEVESALYELDILSRGHVFIGSLCSHFSRAILWSMAGRRNVLPPYVSMDGCSLRNSVASATAHDSSNKTLFEELFPARNACQASRNKPGTSFQRNDGCHMMSPSSDFLST